MDMAELQEISAGVINWLSKEKVGPHYHQAKTKNLLALDTCLARAPFSYGLEDIDWGSWDANLERLGSNPDVPLLEDFLPWTDWVDAMLPLFRDKWMLNDIFHAIMVSKYQIVLNPSWIGAALCFWDSTSNSFAFGPGPMTPTSLDMAALFGFRPHGLSIDVLADYAMKDWKTGVPMRASASEIMLQSKL
ncbi:PREDICTED: LOC110762039 isoform [Prunus dulcis]|uniref:PREDICTED: LOC110762039 isoform n=1 Tax=Prunus dulcis TaxID=3755 RepID=A0A5E4FL88_PRUDU|nr:PREDICTED: LOC110762039 isoform [Prunus dulcis]